MEGPAGDVRLRRDDNSRSPDVVPLAESRTSCGGELSGVEMAHGLAEMDGGPSDHPDEHDFPHLQSSWPGWGPTPILAGVSLQKVAAPLVVSRLPQLPATPRPVEELRLQYSAVG